MHAHMYENGAVQVVRTIKCLVAQYVLNRVMHERNIPRAVRILHLSHVFEMVVHH